MEKLTTEKTLNFWRGANMLGISTSKLSDIKQEEYQVNTIASFFICYEYFPAPP